MQQQRPAIPVLSNHPANQQEVLASARQRKAPSPSKPPFNAPTYKEDPLFYVFQNNDVRRDPLNEKVWEEMSKHDYLFIGGQHRSGTSLLHYLLASHSNISGFTFGKGEHEGQHAQSVFPAAVQLDPIPAAELSCGIREGIFPGRAKSLNGFLLFMQFKDAHLTEKSARYTTAEANQILWESWDSEWDRTSPFRVEKSPPDLVRTRFLQAHFPNSQFMLIARHPLGIAMPRKSLTCVPTELDAQVESLRAHLQHFVLGWMWYVAEDAPHLNKLVLLRLEDLLVDVETSHKALLKVLGIPIETITILKPGSSIVRRPLVFHGSHREQLVTVDVNERTEWIQVWEGLTECFEAAGLGKRLEALLEEFEPALNAFGYSAHPPYILSNKHMLDVFSKTMSWQAIVQRGGGSFNAESVAPSRPSVSVEDGPAIFQKLERCRSAQSQMKSKS